MLYVNQSAMCLLSFPLAAYMRLQLWSKSLDALFSFHGTVALIPADANTFSYMPSAPLAWYLARTETQCVSTIVCFVLTLRNSHAISPFDRVRRRTRAKEESYIALVPVEHLEHWAWMLSLVRWTGWTCGPAG